MQKKSARQLDDLDHYALVWELFLASAPAVSTPREPPHDPRRSLCTVPLRLLRGAVRQPMVNHSVCPCRTASLLRLCARFSTRPRLRITGPAWSRFSTRRNRRCSWLGAVASSSYVPLRRRDEEPEGLWGFGHVVIE